MTRGSTHWWPTTEVIHRLACAAVIAACAFPALAETAGCNRARAIVEEAKALYAAGHPDHRVILQKLGTARQLCPTLGEAWKFAYCSALAIGDEQSAQRYKDRAIFNGVSDVSCGAAGVADAPPPLPTRVRQKFALVIGISKFHDSSVPELLFADKDANDFANVLKDPRYGNFLPKNVHVLTNEEATRGAILDTMNDISLQAQEDDLVVTFISSHGSPGRADNGLAGVGYIITYDTNFQKPWLNALDYQNFAETAARIRARRKVLFLDTCFSGQAFRRGEKALSIDMGVNDKTARMFLSGEGTFVITSSKDNEKSWESETIHNGYFTHYLLEALRRGEERPTVREIFDYLSATVPDAVARDKKASQHPQINPETGPADVRIGVVPSLTSAP